VDDGVNQGHESTRTAQAIINLALMTGNIGRPGTGANSITGQCTRWVRGCLGNATSLLGGYDFAEARDRAHVARVLDLEATPDPGRAQPGLRRDSRRPSTGGNPRALGHCHQHRALFGSGTGGSRRCARSWISSLCRTCYATTETAQWRTSMLPARRLGREEGVFINSERRIGLVKKVSARPGRP